MTINRSQLKKFLQGKCSEEEKNEILNWSKTEDTTTQLHQLFDKYWEEPEGWDYSCDLNSAGLLKKITSEIHQLPEENRNKKFSTGYDRNKNILLRVLGYAAVIMLFLLSLFLIFSSEILNSPDKEQIAYELTIKSTERGQKATIFLSDGTKVIMNSESTLHFPEVFSDTSRRVTLYGEAYFKVAKDKSKPFSVTAGKTVTTALGTSFNINAYAQKDIVISVSSGKVAISKIPVISIARTERHILTPGNALTYQVNTDQLKKSIFNFKKAFLWKEGIIFFENASFEEIEKTLELWYGVKIISDPNNNEIKPYTGEFARETLENVLESMAYSLDFDFSIDKKEVKIMFQHK